MRANEQTIHHPGKVATGRIQLAVVVYNVRNKLQCNHLPTTTTNKMLHVLCICPFKRNAFISPPKAELYILFLPHHQYNVNAPSRRDCTCTMHKRNQVHFLFQCFVIIRQLPVICIFTHASHSSMANNIIRLFKMYLISKKRYKYNSISVS